MKASASARMVLFAFLLSLISFVLEGQNIVQVQFAGYSLMVYDQPVKVSWKEYKAYYTNAGQINRGGTVSTNEKAKSFKVRWDNGEEWEAINVKKEVKSEMDEILGYVDKIIYFGRWTDLDIPCCLVIAKQNGSVKSVQVKSNKVVIPEFNLDEWKKIYTFYLL
jgi:hypothetical protein